MIVLLAALLLPGVLAFAPGCKISNSGIHMSPPWRRSSIRPPASELRAVTKRQILVLDGAELSYYIKSLAQQRRQILVSSETGGEPSRITLPNLAPRSPRKRNRVGAITFVTATVDKDVLHWNDDEEVWLEKGTQILGVEVPSTIKNS